MCGSCSGDSCKCDCGQPRAKKTEDQEAYQDLKAQFNELVENFQEREEQLAFTTGVGRCPLFLEASVGDNKKTAPLGAAKFEKVNVQLNKV